nr:MAG TPA: hypothetical protein [Caudoviricetes sp.]
MKKILNLTQHNASAEQKAAGVYDMPDENGNVVKTAVFRHVDFIEV